jgi:hypothetical protein
MLLLRHSLDELQKSIGFFTFAKRRYQERFPGSGMTSATRRGSRTPLAQPQVQFVDPLVSILSAPFRLTSE